MRFNVTNSSLVVVAVITANLGVGGCLTQEGFPGSEPEQATSPTSTANTPPDISGSPSTAIMVGDQYSFRPEATDDDGDNLTFSIDNKPVWADFDAATGVLSGAVTLADIGIYNDIGISVSDGVETASLPAFSVEVTQAALGSVTLSWSPPTENTDGSTLTNLAGYRVYYGRSASDLTNQILVDNPSISTLVVENLLPVTYYFAATAINNVGQESVFSNIVQKTPE